MRLFVLLFLIGLCVGFWFTPTGQYNCHCMAWHPPECRCIGRPGEGVPVDEPRVGDIVTYSYGEDGYINHSAVYVGNGWCKGKLGALPAIYHPIDFVFPYGTHHQAWRPTP